MCVVFNFNEIIFFVSFTFLLSVADNDDSSAWDDEHSVEFYKDSDSEDHVNQGNEEWLQDGIEMDHPYISSSKNTAQVTAEFKAITSPSIVTITTELVIEPLIVAETISSNLNEGFFVHAITTGKMPQVRQATNNGSTIDPDAGKPLEKLNETERQRINDHFQAWLNATTITPLYINRATEPKGPFYGFIKNLCNVTISRLSGRKIQAFLKSLCKALKDIGCGYIMKRWVRTFREQVKVLTDFRGKLVRPFIEIFCNYTLNERPAKDKFFKTMNPLFTVSQDYKFDDYIYDLKRFGASRLSNLGNRTLLLFQKIIHNTLMAQDKDIVEDIRLHFNLMLSEYYEFKKKGEVPL